MIIDSGIVTGSLQVIGNTEVTGSLKVTEGITGSLKGNSDTATSASHADQADIATNALTASYLSGYVSPFPFTGSAIVSGSLIITGSTASSEGFIGALQGNADTATSASYAANSTTASYALASTSASHAISADSATSASYAANSTTASYAVNSTSSSYAVNSTSASHAASADNAISSSYALNATSAASAISASSVPYSGLTGTVPTWNQDTTGNASTATSSSYAANATSASYALSATTSSFAINADTVDGIHASAFVPNSATSSFATQTYVNTAVSNLVDSSPSTLDTLNELAAALGDDPNFATTVATSIGTKQAQLNGTGFVKISGTTVSYDNSTYTPTSRTLTINGTEYDLSADRSWTISSVVSASSVPYSGLTGTVPTWNQNTSGNAATATSASYATSATSATSASYATTATSATSATSATTAGSATSASYAANGVSITNTSDNRILTSVSSTTINAEANLTFDGTTLNVASNLRAGNGNSGPAGTAFSHTLAGVSTNRVVNFDGNGTTPSVWWTNGSRAYGAIDAQDPGMTFWANNGSGWQQQMAVNYGNVVINTDIRSPIFYDSNNTGYYFDGASTSKLNALQVATLDSAITWTNSTYMMGSPTHGFRFNDNGSNINALIIDNSGNTFAYASHRAPIFYDSNNTGYYVDPASTTNLNALTVNGTLSGNLSGRADRAIHLDTNYVGGQQLNPQTYFNNGVGLKVAMTANVGVWSDTLWINGYAGGDVLSMCALHFQRNGQPRMYISAQNSTATSYGTAYEVITEYSNDQAKIGYFQSNSSLRAPIFYDSNDTGYYTDPTSTSKIVKVWSGAPNGNGTAPRWDTSFYVMQSQHWYSHNGTSTMYLGESGDFVSIRGYSTADGSFRAPIFYDSNDTSYYVNPNSVSVMNVVQPYYLRRMSHSTGHLEGSYNNIGGNSANSNPIYTIGSAYNPTDTSLSGMYGIGYAHPNFWGSGKTSSWGLYVAAGGTFVVTLGEGSTSIWAANDIVAYSDIRVKDNIEVIENALDKIKAIRGVTFTRKDALEEDKDRRHAGVIAQEVMKVLPEVVTGTEEDKYSVAYGNMAGLFIEAIKEQQTQIDELKQLVKQLTQK